MQDPEDFFKMKALEKEIEKLQAEIRYQDQRLQAYNEQFLKDKEFKDDVSSIIRNFELNENCDCCNNNRGNFTQLEKVGSK